MKIITIRYNDTNNYLVSTGKGFLAFDAGWPGTYKNYRDKMKENGLKMEDIRWLMVSHFHIDHAGLAGHFADNGMEFVVFKNQVYAIGEMEALIERKKMPYRKLDRSKMHVMDAGVSRTWLASIGISGEVVPTNGHGEQCVSLILDDGQALTGDLAPETMTDDSNTLQNWRDLRSKGAKHILPAHGNDYFPE